MTRDDAITLVSMIVHGWPGAAWEQERLEQYVAALVPLDAMLATKALHRAQKELRYRPSIAELREFIQAEHRATTSEDWRLLPTVPVGRPAWVERWARARAEGDYRPFPEQMSALTQMKCCPEQPVTDRAVWIQEDEFLAQAAL